MNKYIVLVYLEEPDSVVCFGYFNTAYEANNWFDTMFGSQYRHEVLGVNEK